MRFNDIEFKNEKKKEFLKEKSIISNISKIDLYDNIAVYLMKPGCKGNFKEIAKLANNGKEAISWSIRVFFTNGNWTVQVAPYPDLDKEDINISILGLIDNQYKKSRSLKYFGNLRIGTIKTPKKNIAEKSINFLISNLKDKKLKGIESFEIDHKYSLKNSSKNYKILYNLDAISNTSEQTINKYKKIFSLVKERVDNRKDLIRLNKIDFSNMSVEDKEVLFLMSRKFLTESERIKIAMAFMK